jgi:RNA polymerase-binding transcription factor
MASTEPAVLTDEELAELRALLERVRQENEDDLARSRAQLDDLTADGLLDDPGMRPVSTNAEYLIEDATGIIAEIDAALERMGAGSYGVCTSCGARIPLGRLRLRPYSPTCVTCSS